jgi:molecular chaperone GrpE
MTDHEEMRSPESEPSAPPEPGVEGELSPQAQLEQARSDADEQRRKAEAYLDLAQRSQADFQNYKRRMEQERERIVKDANADLLRKLLPVLDDLERAVANVPSELAEQGWVQGVELIGQKLNQILDQQGLARIGVEGEQFDPYIHEAVAYEEHPRYGEGQVAGVYRPGYQLHDRVLRPAQVAVARAPSVSSPSRGSRQRADEAGGDLIEP